MPNGHDQVALTLDPAELLVVFDALNAWEEIVEEDVEAGDKPPAYANAYASVMKRIVPLWQRHVHTTKDALLR